MTKLDKLVRAIAQGHGRRTERRMAEWLHEHFEHPTRRDGRGRKAQALREAETTLRHVKGAIRWQHLPSLDVNTRQEAKAVLATARHARVPFQAFKERASKLRGRVNKSGRERNARQPVKDCEPLGIDLPLAYSVVRLYTVEMLASAGRELGNCAKDNRFGLHEQLRQRESDFYALRRRGALAAMFAVDREADNITEFLGRGNEEVRLPPLTLRTLLRTLRLNGDDVKACLQRGAASIFVTGKADRRQPDYCEGDVRVWCAKRRLVVREDSKPCDRWSSFRWDGTEWDSSLASRAHRLDSLMTRHPEIAVLANRARQTRRGARPSKRPRR